MADVQQQGLSAVPDGALMAMAIGGAVGVVLALLEKRLPKNAALWIPGALCIGFACAIAVFHAFSSFLGVVVCVASERFDGKWMV